MDLRSYPPQAWSKPTGYVASHCNNCAAGWTREAKEGGILIVCLLDREPVPSSLASCNRYEPREKNDG